MNWLKKIVLKWADNERYADVPQLSSAKATRGGVAVNRLDTNRNGLTFTVHKAAGGHIVRFHMYDERNDRHEESLHIITDQDDFSDTLGKIVFMECLRK